ncbi:hypothetical protein CCP3SC1_350003 [Gammaproteobacteria bacterium]
MAHPKYKVMSFEQRGPAGMAPPAQGEWFYYEIGVNNVVTLTGYRAGIQADVEHAVEAIVDRLNRDKPGAAPPASTASRLIFPAATTNEDEEGNVSEEEEEPTTTAEVDE